MATHKRNSLANREDPRLGKPEDAELYLKGLPKALSHYLKYESPIFWSPRSVYNIYRKHGAEATLYHLRTINRMDAIRVYGPDYPIPPL